MPAPQLPGGSRPLGADVTARGPVAAFQQAGGTSCGAAAASWILSFRLFPAWVAGSRAQHLGHPSGRCPGRWVHGPDAPPGAMRWAESQDGRAQPLGRLAKNGRVVRAGDQQGMRLGCWKVGGRAGVRLGDVSPPRGGQCAAHTPCVRSSAEPDSASGKNAGIWLLVGERLQLLPGRAGPGAAVQMGLRGAAVGIAPPRGEGAGGLGGAQELVRVEPCSPPGWKRAEIKSKAPAPGSGPSCGC